VNKRLKLLLIGIFSATKYFILVSVIMLLIVILSSDYGFNLLLKSELYLNLLSNTGFYIVYAIFLVLAITNSFAESKKNEKDDEADK
jgi:uncharacterized membrane protein